MKLKLQRIAFRPNYTIGKLYIDEVYFCDTLEDFDRDKNRDGDLNDPGEQKVMHETCIPRGIYQVIINMSNRFKRLMPLLLNVIGFEGIRIHNGVNASHTSGCILVGKNNEIGKLSESKDTFERLMTILQSAKEKITIEIT